jgi:hypothetical protein
LRQNRSWIDLANEKISITDVLTTLGIYVPTNVKGGGSRKVHCPFGFYHSDGGLSKAMRVYLQSNTVYCFSCSKRYGPVALAAAKWDCSWDNAAFRLLEDSGYKPKSIKERWAEATAVSGEEPPDTLALAEALKTYCSGISSDWDIRQLDGDVASTLDSCLKLLDSVKTDESALKWLKTCKVVMARKLEA